MILLSTPTRSATSPAARGGARRSPAPTSSSRLDVRERVDRRTPTSSSPPRPTPRRRARSPTPTAACSACAPPSPPRRRAARLAGARRALRPPRRRDRDRLGPRGPGAIATEVPSTPGSPPRRSAAAASAGRSGRQPASFPGRWDAGRRSGRSRAPNAIVRERPDDPARRPCGWAPTETSGPARSRSATGAAVPGARASGSSSPRPTPSASGSPGRRGRGPLERDEPPRAGRDPRADAARSGVHDRGHGRAERERAQRRGVVEVTKAGGG